jgi:hypothetical protein
MQYPVKMDTLMRDGCVVLDGPKFLLKIDPLKELLEEQREFNVNTGVYVLGGFGALANPSSFHHPNIRAIIGFVTRHFWKEFTKTFPGRKLEVLFDRFCIRREGTSTTRESWHRDVCADKLPDDIIIGGWYNMGPTIQQFSCVLGTHLDEPDDNKGFAKIKDGSKYKPLKKLIDINPGQVVFFYQNLVHEVLTKKVKITNYRLYLGWRITDSDKPLFDHTKVIEDQGVPRIPSGQTPQAWAKLHWVNHRHLIENFLPSLKPNVLEKSKFKSLKESGLPLFKPYSKDDLEIRQPRLLV